jgi:hypothetical protein
MHHTPHNLPLQIFLFVFFVMPNVVQASESKEAIPVQILGMSIEQLEESRIGKIKKIVYVDQPEDTFVPINWEMVYRDGHKINLHVENGVVKSLVVVDSAFATDKGISRGNAFSEVRASYPNSLFARGSKDKVQIHETLNIALYSGDKKTIFVFEYNPDLLHELYTGKEVSVKENRVKDLKLWGMYISDSAWRH